MKLGYNTWSMPTLGFGEAVRHCAGLGFNSVEVTVSEGWTTDVMKIGRGEPAEWKRIIGETGLVITSLTANAPDHRRGGGLAEGARAAGQEPRTRG